MVLKRSFLLVLLVLSCSIASAQDKFERRPTRAGLFAIFETAAGYDITPYAIAETIDEINATKVNLNRYKNLFKNGPSKELGFYSIVLGWQSAFKGDFMIAGEYFKTNIEVRNNFDDELGQAIGSLYLGYSLYQSLEYDSALVQFELTRKLSENYGFENLHPVSVSMIAQTLLVLQKPILSRQHFTKAYQLFDPTTEKREKAVILIEIAEMQVVVNEIDSAKLNLITAFKTFEVLNDKPMMAIAKRDLGLLEFRQGNYEKSLEYFEQSMRYSPELSVAKLIKNTYLKLYTKSSLLQKHELSNEYNILYTQLRDSIDLVERSRMVSSQLTRKELLVRDQINDLLEKSALTLYENLSSEELLRNQKFLETEIEKLEKERIIEDLSAAKYLSDQLSIEREEQIKQLMQEKTLQETALAKRELLISRQQTVRNTLLVAALFSIVIAILLYTRFRNQKKSHQKLDEAYKELTATHAKLIETQEQLVQSQKMASLGQMTAGVAHEIQNPLNFVNNFSELTLEMVNEVRNGESKIEDVAPIIIDNIRKIHEHGRRADKIVKGMLMHSSPNAKSKEPTDINSIIEELIELSYHGNKQKLLKSDVNISLDLAPDLPMITIAKNEIGRVLVNIFNNAFYSLGKKYDKSSGSEYKPELSISTRKTSDNFVELAITDNGIGIKAENLSKIFDPFFTTKPPGEGTGLGLSIIYNIITKDHNGTIKVTSDYGENCSFIIKLPL